MALMRRRCTPLRLITKEQLVMEGIASVFTSKKPVQFHVQCFYVWDAERRVVQS